MDEVFSVASSLAAGNILIAALCGIFAGVGLQRLWKNGLLDEARFVVWGMVLFAGGWALHRAYWAVNRMLEAQGHDYLLTSVYKSFSWITLFPMLLILFGLGFLLVPAKEEQSRGNWLFGYSVFVLTTWLLLAALL